MVSPASSTTGAPAAPATGWGASGSSIAIHGAKLLVADEDRRVLWTLATSFDADTKPSRIELPGRPAQVVSRDDRILLTIRDPGLLLVLDGAGEEQRRIPVAADAWGLAVTPDGSTALVTSAWSHRVSIVDLDRGEVRHELDVAREPRGIAIAPDGQHGYVTHLVGSDLSRVDWSGAEAKVTTISLPAAPARTGDLPLSASLGYAAVPSPDGRRLFVARHALGALGRLQTWRDEPSWFGAATVDVLATASDEPLAKAHTGRPVARLTDYVKEPHPDRTAYARSRDVDGPFGMIPATHAVPFTQPRAVVYRRATDTLLIASEGTDELVELDALAVTPAELRMKRYRLGHGYGKGIAVAEHGGAPSGIALSKDESTAYVFCRTTFEVAAVPLVAPEQHVDPRRVKLLKLGDDPLLDDVEPGDPKRSFREAAALGRKLFHSAIDEQISRGLACAGCHPDGRDDGHVWFEIDRRSGSDEREQPLTYLGSLDAVTHLRTSPPFPAYFSGDRTTLFGEPRARQTPMLAGRMRGSGVYGWRGESDDLPARIEHGFVIHRWYRPFDDFDRNGHARALAAFVLSGLVPPPKHERPLTPTEARGEELFESDQVGCAGCHLSSDGYQNGAATTVGIPAARRGVADESAEPFKVPSLLFVGGTPPYLHDGSAPTLERLMQTTANHMGKTSHLSADDRAALVAFMRTL